MSINADSCRVITSARLADVAGDFGLPMSISANAELGNLEVRWGELIILFHDPRSGEFDAAGWQACVTQQGGRILFVEYLADCLRIGPLVAPGQAGCIACRNYRMENNLRRPVHDGGLVKGRAAAGPGPVAVASALLRELLADTRPAQLTNGYATVDFATLTSRWHRFTPVTHCEECDPPGDGAPDPAPPSALQLQRRLKLCAQDKRVPNPSLSVASLRAELVDRECGIIKHVFHDTSSALMPMSVAEMQLPGLDAYESGYGRAETQEASELVAILEAVERYAGHMPRAGQARIRGSYQDLSARFGTASVLDPVDLILHGEEQYTDPLFALMRYDPALETDWCWGHALVAGHPILVPEQVVYYRLPKNPDRPENRFVFDSSNGCSLGGCLEEAILGGLYEVVERDAYLTAWYAQYAPRRIAVDSVTDQRSRALIARSRAEGYDIHLIDMTTDTGIPAVWGMIVDPSDDPVVKSYCASACHGRWDEAIFSALVEITTSMGVYRRSMKGERARAEELLADHSLVAEMPDHVMLFSHPETFERLEFLLDGDELTLAQCRERLPDVAEPDLTRELERHLAGVGQVAKEVVVVDQGFDTLDPLGLSCVKVLVPGLMPVTFGHQNRRIDPARVTAAATARGFGGPAFTEATVNRFPHNFP